MTVLGASLLALSGLINVAAALPAHTQDEWLQEHRAPLDETSAKTSPAADFETGRIFLLGEIHGIAHGQQADLLLLKQVHRSNGVRFYVGEFDPVQADAFNHFLVTGDSRRLDAVFAGWRARGMQWANEDFRTKLKAIRAWNQTLPAGHRIKFLGADETHDFVAACAWLAARLPRTARSEKVMRLARLARDPAGCVKPGALANLARELPQKDRRRLDPVTADYIAALAVEASEGDREARIAANIRRHLSQTRANFYGLWGLAHVIKARVNETRPMALRLVQEGVAVKSVVMLYLDGAMMIPVQQDNGQIGYATTAYTVDSEEAALVEGIEPFARAAKWPMTQFSIAGQGSPFRHSSALTRVGGRFGRMQPFVIDAGTASDGFWTDRILISRNSPATKPVSNKNCGLSRHVC